MQIFDDIAWIQKTNLNKLKKKRSRNEQISKKKNQPNLVQVKLYLCRLKIFLFLIDYDLNKYILFSES